MKTQLVNSAFKSLICLAVFSLAMGFLETSVVVYLRELYYPDGFTFPLVTMPKHIAVCELYREAATLLMLIGVAFMAGTTNIQRWLYFLYAFAIWDLSYYLFLKLLLNWPASLFTWDILFLLPAPWLGPVIAPCIIAFTFIAFTLLYSYKNTLGNISLGAGYFIFFALGTAVLLVSFLSDYYAQVPFNSLNLDQQLNLSVLKNHVPKDYNWYLFALGEALLLGTFFSLKTHKSK